MIEKGAEPYLLPAGKRGVLLVHGFTGSPSEMRLLANYLHEQNFTVLALRLPGHGTRVADLVDVKYQHWLSAVEDAYHVLRDLCCDISVVGLSMGGLLSLQLSHLMPINRVVSLSAPIDITDNRVEYIWLYRLFKTYVHKKQKTYPDVDFHFTYDQIPIKPLNELVKLIKKTKKILPQIKTPCLVVQSKREHTVKPSSAEYIYNNISSTYKKLIWLERSGHIVTLDKERDLVFKYVCEFLECDIDEHNI